MTRRLCSEREKKRKGMGGEIEGERSRKGRGKEGRVKLKGEGE